MNSTAAGLLANAAFGGLVFDRDVVLANLHANKCKPTIVDHVGELTQLMANWREDAWNNYRINKIYNEIKRAGGTDDDIKQCLGTFNFGKLKYHAYQWLKTKTILVIVLVALLLFAAVVAALYVWSKVRPSASRARPPSPPAPSPSLNAPSLGNNGP